MTRPVHIIANPNAGGGRARRTVPVLRRLLDAEGIPHVVDVTLGPGHARDLASALHEPERVLVVGGDGTVHEVVNGLLGGRDTCDASLALCPVGTGNDFHRMIRAPRDPAGVVAMLGSGSPRAFDTGRVTWDGGEARFVNLFGVGIDVEVLRRRRSFRRLPGLLQYGAALMTSAARFEHVPLRVEFEGEDGEIRRVEARALLHAVTVGPSVAGGLRLSPTAQPDDALLDLFLARDLGFLGLARHLPSVIRGTHASIPEVRMERIRRARLESMDGSPLHFELDGELMPGPFPRLDVEVVPASLPVLERAGAATPVATEEGR